MTFASPVYLVSAIITILAVLFYFWTGLKVGQMRSKHKVDAPAMTGNPEFERAVRVQVNTLEWMPIFLPLLWLATIYFSPAMSVAYISWLPALFGVVWILGRILYMNGYLAAPEKRSTGFLIAMLGALGLLVCSIVGIAMAFSVS